MNQQPWRDKAILRLHYVTEADYCAAAALRVALEKAERSELRQKLEEFRCDHCRHVRDLRKVVREEGGSLKLPCNEAQYFQDERDALTVSESDEEIIRCLQTIVESTSSLYTQALEYDLPGPIPVVLENGLTDVLRHQAWLEEALGPEEKPIILRALTFPVLFG